MKQIFIAALLLAATVVQAETPAEERRAKLREAHQKAEQVCKDKQGAERRTCMGQELCSQAKDPAKCHELVARHGEALQKAYDACKDKQGAEQKNCLRDQLRPRS